MKKVLIIILSLALMLTFAACGEKNGGKSPSESSAPAESGNTPSSKAGADENKYYGIGEAAEYEEYRITIDKVERVSDTSIFWNPKEGYSYIKVYVTVENIDTEAVSVDETPLCIVRDGDYNAELSDYSRNTDVINFLQDGIFANPKSHQTKLCRGHFFTVFPEHLSQFRTDPAYFADDFLHMGKGFIPAGQRSGTSA